MAGGLQTATRGRGKGARPSFAKGAQVKPTLGRAKPATNQGRTPATGKPTMGSC